MRKMLALFCITVFVALCASAQSSSTTISDTLTGPDGSPASGLVRIRAAKTFTTTDGRVIPAGSTTLTNVVNGNLAVALAPTVDSRPAGSYYVANYSLQDGGFMEYWMVPPASMAVDLSSLRAEPPPQNQPPNLMFSFYQLNPPINCLNEFPEWTAEGWICSSGTGAITSVFGRTGVVVSQTGDYTLSQITATFNAPLSLSGNALSLLPSGVTPGSYTSANITVDQYGRVTAASNGSGGGGGSSIFQQWQFGTNTAINSTGNYVQLTATPSSVLSLTQTGTGTSGTPYIDTIVLSVQGTDTKLMSAGTIGGGVGLSLCTDSLGGATTSGCPNGAVTSVFGRVGAVVASNGDYTIAQLTASYTAPIVLTGTTLSVSNATTGAVGVVQLTGDLGGTGTSPSVLQVHGVAFPATGASFDALPILTASNTVGYYQINGGSSCGDATHGISYNSTTHLFGCQSITGSGGGVNITVNGGGTLGSPVNLQTGAAVNGLTVAVANAGSSVAWAVNGAATDAAIASPYSGVGACSSSTWASTLTRNAAPTCTQPGFSNLSGAISLSQTQLTTNGDLLTVIGGVLARLGQGSNGTFLGVSGGALGYYAPTAGSLTFPVTVSGTLNSGGIPCFNSAIQMSSSSVLPAGDFVLGGGAGACPTATFSIVPVANGGTGLANGTSGGVLYYSAPGTLASSAALTQYGLVYGGGAGAAPTVIAPPTTNGYYLCGYNVVAAAAVAPTCALQGISITAITSASPPALTAANNAGLITFSNASATAVTGPTLANNIFFEACNINTGLVTYTPASGTVNGNATQIVPNNWCGFEYTDNSNTRMPVFPSIGAFANTGANAAETFNSASGAFGTLTNIVTGPGSSAANDVVAFNGPGGLTILDTGILYTNITTQTSNASSGQLCTYTGANKICVPATALPNGVTATTQSANDNSTKVATTAYVDGKSRIWQGCVGRGLGDGLNAIPAGTYLQTTCYNTTGATVTITGLKCFTDNGGTSTMNASGHTLGALLTGAVTCTASYAVGTQSANVALTNGDYIAFTFVADGTSKQTDWVVLGTY
jgi:hypothetical protein